MQFSIVQLGIRIFIVLFISGLLQKSVLAQETIQNRIAFDYLLQTKDSMDLGEKAIFHFPFSNVGDTAFYFTKVRSSCGCLVAEWPREAIEPGESGEIKGIYDSRRIGPISKTISVELNDSEEMIILRIKGSVWPKE
jgi:hypothetical protein